MSQMVERVARAIYEGRNGAGAFPWSRRDAGHKAPYLQDARAAIEALREPTEGMLAAGSVAEGDGNLETEARNIYSAMIDAALAP